MARLCTICHHPERTLAARIQGEVPSATEQLPSVALGTRGGGEVAVDARDADGVRALDPVFEFDLALPELSQLDREVFVGSRVYVRFHHGGEPLARRWTRRLRRLLLERFRL